MDLDITDKLEQLNLLKKQLAAIEKQKSEVLKEVNKNKELVEIERLRIEATQPKKEFKYFGPEFKPIPFCDSEDWLINQAQLRESQLAELKLAQEVEKQIKERKYKNELIRLEKEKSKLGNGTRLRETQLNNHKQNVAFQKVLRTEKPELDLPPITFPVIRVDLPPLPQPKPEFPYLYPILVLLLSTYLTLSYN